MSQDNKTSTHISGFWFHISWDEKGNFGKDQNGNIWVCRDKPEPQDKRIREACESSYKFIMDRMNYVTAVN